MDPLYVFEGYSIEEPWVIVLALAHNYGRLKEVPSYETNGVGVCDVADQYGRGTRSSYALANWIRQLDYAARAYPGPGADALSLIPPAIASGLGELGKHGSLISPQFGAGVRLAAVTTDMPLPRPSLLISAPISFVRVARSVRASALPMPFSPRSKWSVGWSAGTSILTNASRISPKPRRVGFALRCVPGHGPGYGRSCSPRWQGVRTTERATDIEISTGYTTGDDV